MLEKIKNIFLKVIKDTEIVIIILGTALFLGFCSGALIYGVKYLDCMDGRSSTQTVMGYDTGGEFHTDMKVESLRADYCHDYKGYNIAYMIKQIVVCFAVAAILLFALELILAYFKVPNKILYYIVVSIIFVIGTFAIAKQSLTKEEAVSEIQTNYDIKDFKEGIWRTEEFNGHYYVSLGIYDDGKCNYFYYESPEKESSSYVVSGFDNCEYTEDIDSIKINSFDDFSCVLGDKKNIICDDITFLLDEKYTKE